MDIDNSLQQVRQAHRICAGFYQQVLPRIERVRELMDVQFLQWIPISFDPSPSKGVSPFKYWGWNFLPLMDTSFTFFKKSASLPRYFSPNDYILLNNKQKNNNQLPIGKTLFNKYYAL